MVKMQMSENDLCDVCWFYASCQEGAWQKCWWLTKSLRWMTAQTCIYQDGCFLVTDNKTTKISAYVALSEIKGLETLNGNLEKKAYKGNPIRKR